MLKRKIAIGMMIIGLNAGIGMALAQDQAQPTPQAQEQGSLLPIAVGGDILARAGTALDSGNYEKAVQDYSLFILLNPTLGQGYYLRGLAYSRLNDLDHALADLNTALTLPEPSEESTGMILNARAVIYLLQNDVEAALKDLDASIVAVPDMPDAYSQRARVFLLNQRYEDALKDYDKLLELAPDYSPGYAGRALAYASLGDADAALADYDRLIEIEPDNPGAYINRAILNAGLSNFDAALTDINAAIELLPDEASLYLQRAAVQQSLDKPVEAAQDYLEWISRQETRRADGDILPGESQVLPLASGIRYNLTFEAAAGQSITLSARARAEADTDPLIVLLDSAGQPIAGDDDSGDNFDAVISDFVIPSDGSYTLVVSHAGGSPDGAIRVLLELGE